jgi:hypothetical protein
VVEAKDLFVLAVHGGSGHDGEREEKRKKR